MPERLTPIAKLKDLVRVHGSRRCAATVLGISETYFGQLLNGRRAFSDAMLERLGLERVERFVERAS